MVQLSQLLLVASVVASSISYSIDSTKNMPRQVPEPPVEPSESDFEYPDELMHKILASMSPEELKELTKPIELEESSVVDRIGNTNKCVTEPDESILRGVIGTDRINYWAVENQTVTGRNACKRVTSKDTYDNKCSPANAQPNTRYCCSQRMAVTTLLVIPRIDYSKFNKSDVDRLTIKRKVMVNADCICDQVISNCSSCPDPDSIFDFNWMRKIKN